MQFTLMGLKFDLATIVLSVALVRAANVYHVSRIFGRVFERKRGIRREKETAGDFYLLFFSFFFFRTSNPTAIPFFLFSFFLFFSFPSVNMMFAFDGPPSSVLPRSSFVRLLSDDVEPLDDVLKREKKFRSIKRGGEKIWRYCFDLIERVSI